MKIRERVKLLENKLVGFIRVMNSKRINILKKGNYIKEIRIIVMMIVKEIRL